MSPIIQKTLFRMKKLNRPLAFGVNKKMVFGRALWRNLFIVILTLFIIFIICMGKMPVRTKLNEGDIAIEDMFAPFGFKYESGFNEAETKKAKALASSKTLEVYNSSPDVSKAAEADADRFFTRVASIRASMQKLKDADLSKVGDSLSALASLKDIKTLATYPKQDLLKETALKVLKDTYSSPVISDKDKESLLASKKEAIQIYEADTRAGEIEPVAKILSVSEGQDKLDALLSESEISPRNTRDIMKALIVKWVRPDLNFSLDETELARRQAASSVKPVYNVLERAKGEIIIRKGQRVVKEHLIQTRTINSSYDANDIFSQFWGLLVLIPTLMFLLMAYLKYFEPKTYNDDKLLMLSGITLLFATISARLIVSSPLPSYFIPVAAVGMLLTILINGRVASVCVTTASVLVALVAGAKLNIFLISLVGGITAICTIYRVRERSQIIKTGIYVGMVSFLTICAMGILSNLKIAVFLKEGLWGMASGMTSAALTMIFLPLIESAFKITTDIKLLELADLNHPLLKKMVTEAPGTYHHSMVVGNLAEAACDTIGANSLLARVGAYYHDIGKTEKSEYFAENQREPADMHSKLSPSMSSLIITNHVKDGVELAEKHNLGNAIKDIVQEHHGVGLVTYFYHQALEKKTQPEAEVSEEGFRYLGPKPQTRESAIVLLADSVEAASRVLQNPTPQRLKELVRKIINNKFIDRQLDECELTLKDINKIADSFVRVLTGIHHSRVEYPEKANQRHANNNNRRSKKNKA
ncbi:MAG: HDIG domain-containing protein [Candidatus Omnitrophica bacterium]|nr:HDIG domain-containing protein [Candidatus Omnitrophota bacterium]